MPAAKRKSGGGTSELTGSGIPVDESGGPTVDPTKNVLDLVEAANRRQDDLRHLTKDLHEARIEHVREIGDLRALHRAELMRAEAARLDSIRQVDREDASKTAIQAANAIQTLANTTNTTAETLRNQVATTAQQAAQQRAMDTAETNKRLSAVELALSEGKGKTAMVDPQMERLSTLVEQLMRNQNTDAGKGAGINAAWLALLGFISLVATVIGIFAALKP